jgi:hypothetical protein
MGAGTRSRGIASPLVVTEHVALIGNATRVHRRMRRVCNLQNWLQVGAVMDAARVKDFE